MSAGGRGVIALIVLVTATCGMDTTIVNVVLPAIADDLGMSVSSSAFVVILYLVPIAGLCLALGKYADGGALRRCVLLGAALLTASSLLAAVSLNGTMLFSMRFLQGLGAAFVVATAPIMAVRLLPEESRAMGMASIAAGSGVSSIVGAPVGGIIASYLSWNWVFVVCAAMGMAVLILACIVLPRASGERSRIPDPGSTLLMLFGMCLIMLSLQGYTEHIIEGALAAVLGAAGLVLLTAALLRSRRSEHPLINRRLMENRRFGIAMTVFLLSTLMGAGMLYILPYYFSISEGMDSASTGFIMAVASVTSIIMAGPTGRWCDRSGCRTPACLSLLLRVMFCLGFVAIDPAFGLIYAGIMLVVMGMSFGISGTSQSTRMIVEAGEDLAGEAGSVAMLINYVGYAVGVTVFAIVFVMIVPGDGIPADGGVFMTGFRALSVMGAAIAAVAMTMSVALRDRPSMQGAD